jgi:hypothetical protein
MLEESDNKEPRYGRARISHYGRRLVWCSYICCPANPAIVAEDIHGPLFVRAFIVAVGI